MTQRTIKELIKQHIEQEEKLIAQYEGDITVIEGIQFLSDRVVNMGALLTAVCYRLHEVEEQLKAMKGDSK